jgi:cytochrome c
VRAALLWVCLAAGACTSDNQRIAAALAGGDPAQGKQRVRTYGCVSCHRIPGVRGPEAMVGPPLEKLGRRWYIAGVLPGTASNLVRWVRHPQAEVPGTAMPELNVSEQDARDIAAYLYTLQ